MGGAGSDDARAGLDAAGFAFGLHLGAQRPQGLVCAGVEREDQADGVREACEGVDGIAEEGRFAWGVFRRLGEGFAVQGAGEIHTDLRQLLEQAQAPFGAQDGGIKSFGGVGHA